ncbi:aciA Formate dehydrogenase [Candida maltosa Xu316]
MGKPKILMALYAGGKHAKEEARLLGTVENELGIRKLVEEHGYELVTTDDKDPEPNSAFDENLEDAEIIITTPFYPAYVTRSRIAKAPKLKLCITAGVGSDHYDLEACNERGIAVIEVTGSNVVSVAEHAVMTMLILLRNYGEGHHQAVSGGWDIAAVAKDEFDLEDKVIATVGAGRIGMVNKSLISRMKKGSYLINTARGALTVPEDVADAVNSGHIAYGGDVWPVQPAPKDMPWRTMHNPYGEAYGNAMTVHVSGTSLDAQARYANGVKQILTEYFNKTYKYRPQDVIVIDGDYATKAYGNREKK